MNSKESLYLVIPAYNEEANIQKTVLEWRDNIEKCNIEKYNIVVADSGSTDETHNILLKIKSDIDNLIILSDTRKEHGPKCIALYKYACSQGADWVFQTDADGQTNPAEFVDFWNDRNSWDGVIGSRPYRGDGWARKMVEEVLKLIIRYFFKIRVPDTNAPFRLMKSSMLEKYLMRFTEDYNLPNVMLTTFFVYYSEKIVFKDISFSQRKGGKNSINIPKIVKIGIRAIGDFRAFSRNM